ncbi:MAG: hypothetical protein GY769_06295 [bacterium]|nr:hypothetical protein [bacterium]
MKSIVVVLCLLFLGGSAASAQTSPACSDERSRDFDFWIGEWDVTANGKIAGTNSIRPILDGCVLQETWSGAGGSAGSSFNFYNPQTKSWQQFWVWRNGTTLDLAGSYADGKMVLEGESKDREGKAVLNRITWHDNPDGTVRQHWQISKDGGATWQDAFDGLYAKRKPAESEPGLSNGRGG